MIPRVETFEYHLLTSGMRSQAGQMCNYSEQPLGGSITIRLKKTSIADPARWWQSFYKQ